MFVDTAKVSLKAGNGGNGAVSFRHEIYIPKGGPDGGDGGKGGDIVFRADKDTNTLLDFKFSPILTAEDGKNGSGTRSAGRSGKDLIVEVPIGTVVRRDGKIIADLTHDGEEAIIAKGGDGGFGNAHFKSSTRQAPIIAEVGEPGEEFEAELELKLLADVGLVGLPNAGKSTFLSVVSNAKPEIADYPFTTITPNLGMAHIDERDLLIADIPGLIEGASEGKGLGHAFLRHVDRTAVLLHLIDVYNDDAGEAYQTIRNELDKYSDLKDRPEVVALTKCEGLDPEIIAMQTASILAKNPNAKVYTISSQAHQGLTELLRELSAMVVAGKSPSLSETGSLAPVVTGLAPLSSAVASGRLREGSEDLPTISLSANETKNTWQVTRTEEGKFIVTGEKIEKFARRTDLNNYASVNRLRDIIKKLGIRAELTSLGAEPESIISIAGKEFTLVEDY
jgi:GTP-binding protein